MPTKPKPKPKRKYEADEPVSLHPLGFEAALAALLKTKPDAEPSAKAEPSKPRTGKRS